MIEAIEITQRELQTLPKSIGSLEQANTLLNRAIAEWLASCNSRVMDQVLQEYRKFPKRQPYCGLNQPSFLKTDQEDGQNPHLGDVLDPILKDTGVG